MSKENSISIERLRKLLVYDPATGQLAWGITRRGAASGQRAGGTNDQGYVVLRVDYVALRAHRVAFALTYGRWPAQQIDHINGNPGDNRLVNLREVTPSENMQNQHKLRSNSTVGFKGVARTTKGWRVQIKPPGRKLVTVQGFTSPELAHEFYLLAKEMLHPGYVPLDGLTGHG